MAVTIRHDTQEMFNGRWKWPKLDLSLSVSLKMNLQHTNLLPCVACKVEVRNRQKIKFSKLKKDFDLQARVRTFWEFFEKILGNFLGILWEFFWDFLRILRIFFGMYVWGVLI